MPLKLHLKNKLKNSLSDFKKIMKEDRYLNVNKKIIKIIKNPKKIIIFLASKGIIPYNDKKYLKYVYKKNW